MLDKNSIYYKQVQLLLEVLPYVSQEECFALKGGTAINMFVRDMPRLSVDIDLMYLPVEDRQTSLQNIAESFERIAQTIESSMRGTKVYRLDQQGDGILSKLQVEKNGVRIKIEASPVTRGTVREPSVLSVSVKVEEEFGFAETSVVHLDDLYAGKLCAALDRQHPRDFFDVRGLLDNEGISDALMDVFIVYLISSNQPISKLLQPNLIDIKRIYAEQFVGMPIVPMPLEVLEETRVELVSTIHSKLTQNHRDFLIGFKEENPDWSLLPFENIKELPSVKWKILNLQKMPKVKKVEALQKLKDTLKI
ncbi:nucleotidyl transferase AbiEii/AbiGii toxin family protein [Sulfurimonas crateris]|uniref:Nucleotidyl transferase AbiEii/AbiGii toxin family protein n=1 Tax=Sulfurimonas crateris TaxID=2574727 RepID=A0A4U2ZB35_9BACT|nr:nucleotidyl transferase AbiEii/AbiGii toxin family protein [Sulfurimonas crateris]TKI71245.1 nucleotidyl transferase AbiEii/AbiGii toxin family protein [Sulfurimonas crateris]